MGRKLSQHLLGVSKANVLLA